MPEPTDRDPDDGNAPDDGQPRATSTMAVFALVCAILGLLACPPLGLTGLILGRIALDRIDNPIHQLKGRGIARAGAIVGGVGMVLTSVFVLVPLLMPRYHRNLGLQNSIQLRGIQQGMVTFAQGNKVGDDGWFPGLDAHGDPIDLTVAGRFKIMLETDLFTPDYLINPQDTEKTPWDGTGPFTSANYSYALLDISDPGPRRDEWSETLNARAIVIADRNTGSDATAHVSSVWTQTNSGDWRGSITRNDNSTSFETTDAFQTKYGSAPANQNDRLFDSNGTDDALMIHRGQ